MKLWSDIKIIFWLRNYKLSFSSLVNTFCWNKHNKRILKTQTSVEYVNYASLVLQINIPIMMWVFIFLKITSNYFCLVFHHGQNSPLDILQYTNRLTAEISESFNAWA